jgi:hypothetical protein
MSAFSTQYAGLGWIKKIVAIRAAINTNQLNQHSPIFAAG